MGKGGLVSRLGIVPNIGYEYLRQPFADLRGWFVSMNLAMRKTEARWRWVAAVFGLCLAVGNAWAVTLPQYSSRLWQMDDGLPQNSVYAITQTRDGYLWVGTHEGLTRFDGVQFTIINETNAPELKSEWITALYVSRDGSLWIGVDGVGVTRFQNGSFTHFTPTNGLPNNQPRCFLEDKEGAMWIGTEAGLVRWQDGKFSVFKTENGLADNAVRGLCEDHLGVLRIATRGGMASFSNGSITGNVRVAPDMAGNSLYSVCEDRHGTIWIGANDGMTRLEGTQQTHFHTSDGLPDPATVTIVCEDSAGQIWLGTYNGLARVVDNKLLPGQNIGTPAGDLIYDIFEDREGNLWVGGRDGLYRLNPQRFTTYSAQQGLTYNNAMSVCEDRNGSIWIATWGGGLNELKGDEITFCYARTNGLSHDKALCLHESADGTLWAGMDLDASINRIKDGHITSISRQDGVLDSPIKVIHEDVGKRVWIGTGRGMNVLNKNGKVSNTYTTANGLAGNMVMAICEDAAHNIWIGTDGGLTRWANGKFTKFTTREGLSRNSVDALYEDAEHTLWIGTKGGGLNRMKAGKFTAYTTRQGLFSDEIYEILEDDFGYFWMSCRKGIFRVSRKDLDDFDRGAVKQVICTVFGKADGLVSVQCNGIAQPAGWKGRDGRLWFPTIKGVVAVDSRIKNNDKSPPVVIQQVVTDRRELLSDSIMVAMPEELTVSPGRGELEIHYTALSLQAPEKNRFKYQLEGVDPGWIDAGTSHAAHYNNLAPRKYKFRVIGSNNDGVWNETGATLSLVFLPHYWQTWWFNLAMVAAAGLILTLLYRARVARLRGIERLRIQIAADLHDDVGARLTKVAMITEVADRETRETDRNKPHLSNIISTTREIIQAMDEIVWTINPKNDTLDNLANYIFQHAQEYFQNSGVRCRLDLPAALPQQAISTEERHNLFMAVKEALNNVLKHAGATEVRLSLTIEGNRLGIVIADNGRGFLVAEARPRGDGLENMRRRLQRIRGQFKLESQPGKGTKITMEVNLK